MSTASIVALYNRVSELTKIGTAGYVDEDEFNGIIASKQLTLAQILIELEGENKKALDLVNWLKGSVLITADSTGHINLPGDYLHLDTISLKVGSNYYPCDELQTNEVDMVRTSPVLMPDIAQNEANYYFEGGEPIMLPEVAMQIKLRYWREPPLADITLTPAGPDDDDYETATVANELGWPMSAYNLLIYMVLMDYGVELKEAWIKEFAMYGISMEMIKNAPHD